jgi:hypothetical protein
LSEHGAGDRGSDQPGDDPPESADTPTSEEERYRALRERLRAATDDELDTQSFIVADGRAAVQAVLRGGGIADDRGDAEFIGGAIRRIARALRETAQMYKQAGTQFIDNAILREFAWGHSVTLGLEISAEEDVQLGVDDARHAPTIEAARTLGALMSTPPEGLVERASALPAGAVAEYKRLLNHIGGQRNVTLEWLPPDATEVVVVTSVDALHDFAILDREGEERVEIVQVPGALTMADSRRHRFELSLPAGMERPPALKHKQTVQGEYTVEAGRKLKAESLWDSDVMATIEATYDVPGTTATPREPIYRLLDASPLLPHAPRMF